MLIIYDLYKYWFGFLENDNDYYFVDSLTEAEEDLTNSIREELDNEILKRMFGAMTKNE
jgi:hypothetical protein